MSAPGRCTTRLPPARSTPLCGVHDVAPRNHLRQGATVGDGDAYMAACSLSPCGAVTVEGSGVRDTWILCWRELRAAHFAAPISAPTDPEITAPSATHSAMPARPATFSALTSLRC